ncbi:MAG: TlpA family protein disulfide reductase [Bacteroidia bacterium]
MKLKATVYLLMFSLFLCGQESDSKDINKPSNYRPKTDTISSQPRVRLNLKNATGSKMKLLQFVGQKVITVDSATFNSSDGTIELKGLPIQEEMQFQLVIYDQYQKMFVLYPVLDSHSIPEIYFDLSLMGSKETYLNKFRYDNSPSSVDWNNIMHFPAEWKKAKYNLEKQFKGAINSNIQKEIDSLSNLVRNYIVAVLKNTKSVATVCTGLNLLKFDYSHEDFGTLLTDIQDRFPQSELVKNKINWFQNIKEYIPPTSEVLANGTQAIDFTIDSGKGDSQKLSSYNGKYILLDFWASWCKPCREESPYLRQAFGKYEKHGFKIIQVSIDHRADEKKWRTAIIEDNTQQFIHTRKDKDDVLIKQYKVNAIPVNYLIDPSGKIVGSNLRGEALGAKLKEVFNY